MKLKKSIRNVINKNLGTGKNYTLRSSMNCIYRQYYQGDYLTKKVVRASQVRGDVNIGFWYRKTEGKQTTWNAQAETGG